MLIGGAQVLFCVLGPVQAVGDGPVEISHPAQRRLLVSLLARAGQVVPVDVLADELWHQRPPPTAGATLRSYLARLRHALDPAGDGRSHPPLIEARHGGYVLRSDGHQIDSDVFADLVRQGLARTDDDPAAAVRLLGHALALWRGSAFLEIADTEIGEQLAGWLDELRLTALEGWFEARLTVGESMLCIPELSRLVLEHPLRERLWGHLMEALLTQGRRGQALQVHARASAVLREQLGVSPCARLAELHARALSEGVVVRR